MKQMECQIGDSDRNVTKPGKADRRNRIYRTDRRRLDRVGVQRRKTANGSCRASKVSQFTELLGFWGGAGG